MRVRHSCNVDSRMLVGPMVLKEVGEFLVSLEGNENSILAKVCIEYETTDPDEIPKLETSEGRSSLKIDGNRQRYLGIIELFQTIESALTLNGVLKVHYEDIIEDWLPDNDEEKEKIKVHNFKLTRKEPEEEIQRIPRWCIDGDLAKIDRLRIPLAFFREGRNYFQSQRYIEAFQNFYYILEGLFGGGRKTGVESAMKSSKDFRLYAGIALQAIQRHPDFRTKIAPEFASLRLNLDVDGLIDFIVKNRHPLHHFWVEKKDRYGHPFNQEDFRNAAIVSRTLAWISLEIEQSKALGIWKG